MKTIESIDIEATIRSTRKLLEEDKSVSPALKASIEILLVLITLLINRLGLNSNNSSIPPSSDPNRNKNDIKKGKRKPGAQKGHNGTTLKKVATPDIIKKLRVDPSELPKGKYKKSGFKSRQVIDFSISMEVTEYRAEILRGADGKIYTAKFPKGVNRPVQYGNTIKSHAVYQSQYQLIPYNRVEEFFHDQTNLSVSAGSIYNFNEEAFNKLELFETIVKTNLIKSDVCNADETGINIAGTRHWLHCVSNELWTYYMPHKKRGGDAIEHMGIIPAFGGVLCHDHWKPYFRYDCTHALCNAHHLRELERAWEQDNQEWARHMQELLLKINKAVDKKGGRLPSKSAQTFRNQYRAILKKAQSECPPPDESQRDGKRGKLKRSKSRNLLERLTDFENETLLFIDKQDVPFTNNRGENDIRMTKVQQKISGCFRSMKGAEFFCRIRSYISTCQKNNIGATEALKLLFDDKLPEFLFAPAAMEQN